VTWVGGVHAVLGNEQLVLALKPARDTQGWWQYGARPRDGGRRVGLKQGMHKAGKQRIGDGLLFAALGAAANGI
jgi:hypothetical protein